MLYIKRETAPQVDFAIGYMSGDMTKLTDWYGHIIGAAWVIRSWKIAGSLLTDRMYQVECDIDGKRYTGRTMGANMLWRGRLKAQCRQVPFSKTDAGRYRRVERRQVMTCKGRV